MLDLEAKTNSLNLTPSEKRLFGLSLGEEFRKEEENLKKEVKRLEAKRDSGKKEQKG